MRARNAGLLLGLVAAAQFGVATRSCSPTAPVLAAGAVVLLALLHRPAVRQRASYAGRAAAWSLAAFLPFVAYPVWMLLAGPQHLSGPRAAAPAPSSPLRADLLAASPADPPVQLTRWDTFGQRPRDRGLDLTENAAYLGLPLLIVLVVGDLGGVPAGRHASSSPA